MEWTVLSIGIITALLGVLAPFILFGESHAISRSNGRERRGSNAFPTHSSQDFNKDLSHAFEMTSMAMTMNVWRGTKFSIR
jgi:hypothetical protein